MPNDIKIIRCNDCESQIKKAKRRYKGKLYCSKCYVKLFQKSRCSSCSVEARLPIFEERPICTSCEKLKPCIRCAIISDRIGKLTKWGPVCASCSIYFRENQRCNWCGKLSHSIHKRPSIGVKNRICLKCSRINHKTCSKCRRHRPVAKVIDGRQICNICHEKGDISCQSCGTLMPAGRGKQCETCYDKVLLNKRLSIALQTLSNSKIREHFHSYVKWLEIKIGAKASRQKINDHIKFFQKIELLPRCFPSNETILSTFGTSGLRRFQSVVNWLEINNLLTITREQKVIESERRMINKCLQSSRENLIGYHHLLNYYLMLRKKLVAGKTSLRSIRLSLSSAAKLLELAIQRNHHDCPHQSDLCEYISTYPGRRASITGFINFLKKTDIVFLHIPPKPSIKLIRRRRTEKLKKLLTGEVQLNESERTAIELQYFHDLTQKQADSLIKEASVNMTSEGKRIKHNEKDFFIPFYMNLPESKL